MAAQRNESLMRRVDRFVPLLLAAACSEGSGPPAVAISDSAGVRITTTTASAIVFAELDSLPRLSIGGADASGPTQFFQLQGMYVDGAGRLWIADGQSGELRIFDAGGSHWKTRGGQGEGPGEFVRIRLLGATGADSVVAGDIGLDRITVFDPDGEFVRTERLLSGERPAPRPFDVFADGSILGQLPRIIQASSIRPGQILRDSVELVRVAAGSMTPRRYGDAPGPLWLWTGRSQVPVPFTVNASFDAVGEEVHLVSGPAFRIRVLADGELRGIYGIDRPPRPIGRANIETYRGFVEDYMQEPQRTEYLSVLDDDEHRPAFLPAYDRILAATDGRIWAQVYEVDLVAAHDWDVYDADRRFIGQVRTPAAFHPFVISGEAMAGVWRDELGVEHVRVYGFVRR